METPVSFGRGLNAPIPAGVPRVVSTISEPWRQPPARAHVTARPERAAAAPERRAVAPWPAHRPDDHRTVPAGSIAGSRWPELPPDEPASTPDWTPLLSALRRARALEQEQRGDR